MNREEFINQLRIALSGNISSSGVNENIIFYEQYFDMLMKKGISEAEIIEKLGNPRLLAKSIITADKEKKTDNKDTPYRSEYDAEGKRTGQNEFKITKLPKWLIFLIAIFIVIIFVVLLFSLTFLAIRVFLPIILILIIVRILIKIFRK